MKNIFFNIWEAIRFTYFSKTCESQVELEYMSTKTQKELEEEDAKAMAYLVKDYNGTIIAKYFFLLSTILCLAVSVWFSFVSFNLTAAISFIVLSFLLAKLYVNRSMFQHMKYSFIQFNISVSVELEKAKNPDYQMRKPGFYEDNF